ncbi:MAG TPA: RDD family protein [Luteolibacter sp.]|nr:RDD family protein [Luteolibacter sp.]
MDWYYSANNTQQGPVNDAQFESLVRSGSIQPSTMVWRDGLPDWQQLSLVRPDLVNAAMSPSAPVAGSLKDLNVQAMREGLEYVTSPYGLNFAGFWLRAAAKIIDWVILTIANYAIMAVCMIPMIATSGEGGEPSPIALGLIFLMYGVMIGIPLLYNTLMIAKYGATVGKMACGLKVVMPDGSPLTKGRALGRAAAEMLSQCALYIGYIIAAFDDEKRSLHDHVASTRVIRTR